MKKRLIEIEKREIVAAAEANISQVVACIERETAKGRIVKSEAIAASTGMKRGVERWINVAAKRGLIHFANNQEGWKLGPYVPVILPKTEASPILVQTADCVRALSNGRPASTIGVSVTTAFHAAVKHSLQTCHQFARWISRTQRQPRTPCHLSGSCR